MIQTACNKFVLVLRDEKEREISGIEIPNEGQTKPPSGTIHASGSKVDDENIKIGIGRKCLFHPGVGWEIDYEGITYLVLKDEEIIALP